MNFKSKKQFSFRKKSIKTRIEELGYVDFLKSISPFYNGGLEEIEHTSKLKHLEVLIGLSPPKKEVLKESIHYFAGYDVEVSGLLLVHMAYKMHRYKSDLMPYFLEKVSSISTDADAHEKEKHRVEFLKNSNQFALMLFEKIKNNSKSFIYGVNVGNFLEKRIMQKEESVKEISIKKLPIKKEKLINSFQNGLTKFGVSKKRTAIVRKINFKLPPKRIPQKIMQS
jgi:hypothetical protein